MSAADHEQARVLDLLLGWIFFGDVEFSPLALIGLAFIGWHVRGWADRRRANAASPSTDKTRQS